MQWFTRKQAQDPADFWRDVEKKRGGPVSFVSFATLLGRSDGSRVDLPGLLYVVDDTAWFEDFEKDSWLLRLLAPNRGFQKTEISFGLGEVEAARMVTRRSALRCFSGSVRPTDLRAASPFRQWISVPVVELILRDGAALFFDLIKRREFAALFAGRKP